MLTKKQFDVLVQIEKRGFAALDSVVKTESAKADAVL